MKKCNYCNEEVFGRSDKKYCNVHCRSAYQYSQNKKNESFFLMVQKALKINRKLLKKYNKAGKSTIRKDILLSEGFNPNYFTHYWKNGKGQVYLFVFEFGFLKLKESGKEKYVLVKWQPYMEK